MLESKQFPVSRTGKLHLTGLCYEQNYPNPFNPSTNIRFQLANNQHVEIKVYNIVGKEVRTLTNQQYAAGQHTLVWDGTNNAGHSVVSGVYIYKMTAGKFSQTRKMNLVR